MSDERSIDAPSYIRGRTPADVLTDENKERQRNQKRISNHGRIGGLFRMKILIPLGLAGTLLASQTGPGKDFTKTALDTAEGVAGGISQIIPEGGFKPYESVTPDSILKGSITIKEGIVLRKDPHFPIDAKTGGHNSVGLVRLGDDPEYQYENLMIVSGWDGNIPQDYFVIEDNEGNALYGKLVRDGSDPNLSVSKNAIMVKPMAKIDQNGRRIISAVGVPAETVGQRIGPLVTPAP